MRKVSKHRQAFFSLSAHAFLTKPVEQQEGYTVLYLSEEGTSIDRAPTPAKSEDEGGADQAKEQYVLWELS